MLGYHKAPVISEDSKAQDINMNSTNAKAEKERVENGDGKAEGGVEISNFFEYDPYMSLVHINPRGHGPGPQYRALSGAEHHFPEHQSFTKEMTDVGVSIYRVVGESADRLQSIGYDRTPIDVYRVGRSDGCYGSSSAMTSRTHCIIQTGPQTGKISLTDFSSCGMSIRRAGLEGKFCPMATFDKDGNRLTYTIGPGDQIRFGHTIEKLIEENALRMQVVQVVVKMGEGLLELRRNYFAGLQPVNVQTDLVFPPVMAEQLDPQNTGMQFAAPSVREEGSLILAGGRDYRLTHERLRRTSKGWVIMNRRLFEKCRRDWKVP